MIHLEDITEANFTEALRLEVGEDQRRFVAPAAGILARGYVYRSNRARVYAIMAEDVMVGLALVRDLDEPPACYDLQQFMIDRRHQGRGCGGEAAGGGPLRCGGGLCAPGGSGCPASLRAGGLCGHGLCGSRRAGVPEPDASFLLKGAASSVTANAATPSSKG